MEKVTKWFLRQKKGRVYIQRTHYGQNGRKDEYLPESEYKHLLNKPHELRRFVMRLNNIDERKLLALENIEKREAFFTDQDLEEFKQRLIGRYSKEKDALDLFNYLQKYALAFFYAKGRVTPQSMKLYEFEWGQSLIGKGSKSFVKRFAPKTIKYVVNVTNSFLEFLHEKYRDIPLVKLKPRVNPLFLRHTMCNKMELGG